MTEYLVLLAPSHNRVYAQAAPTLALAEATAVIRAQVPELTAAVDLVEIAGINYLRVGVGGDATSRSGLEPNSTSPGNLRHALSNLSGTYALFRRESQGQGTLPTLTPIERDAAEIHPSELVTQQKYPGKTNEQFTHLLLNVTAAATDRPQDLAARRLRVLDPMCGRGTTLNLALRLGLSPLGADIDRKDFEAYRTFLVTWLRSQRMKHTADTTRLTHQRKVLGSRLDVSFAPDKAAWKAGQTQSLTYFGCSTTELGRWLPAGKMDAIIADLPYGVQHGAHGGSAAQPGSTRATTMSQPNTSRWNRKPLDLLDEALPVWRTLLRRGGALGLAVNLHTAAHRDVHAVLTRHGLRPVGETGRFRHRVDASIDRNIVIAVRTDHPSAPETP
ncbi:TRM11 family SAM-dependent methyltransferase [Devriesea agamarum]|uniref:TRM11 family SAM-dependent methyltransferase n=1 Tax=Devriesea agamarum TaxID=472569 RepID=UPI00071CE295|nr:SAM-dependent methyltransferase [Devriesea agamarum]